MTKSLFGDTICAVELLLTSVIIELQTECKFS